ncbi:MAG TPA: PilZ domain-containing protein [Geobacteraceae bacterium]
MQPKRVLLGGDPCTLSVLLNFFSNTDKFQISMVHTGSEAVRSLTETRPDLTILDIDMVGKAGDACCKAVKQTGFLRGLPIALMVSMDKNGEISRCLDAECDALLVKPLRHEQLAVVTSNFLFRKRYTASRFDVHLPIHYGIHNHKLVCDYSADLSTGGIFIAANQIASVGTRLSLAFTLPGDDATVKCAARVAWQNGLVLPREPLLPPGMGLEFLDIDPQGVNTILRFLYSEERERWEHTGCENGPNEDLNPGRDVQGEEPVCLIHWSDLLK